MNKYTETKYVRTKTEIVLSGMGGRLITINIGSVTFYRKKDLKNSSTFSKMYYYHT
jgi:hypothetical protein